MALDYLDTVDALNVASTVTLPELEDQSLVIVTGASKGTARIKSITAKTQAGRPYVEIELEAHDG